MTSKKAKAPTPPVPNPPTASHDVPPEVASATKPKVANADLEFPVVGARVPRRVFLGLDAMAKRLRTQNPSEPENRSTAIRTCFDITDVMLEGDRLDMLSKMDKHLVDAARIVIDAGFKAQQKKNAK